MSSLMPGSSSLTDGVYAGDSKYRWAYFVVKNGVAHPLTSREQFDALGIPDSAVKIVPDTVIESMPQQPYGQAAPPAQTQQPTQQPSSGGFNEAGYLAANPDVAQAVAQGYFQSGMDHYQQIGHAENRSMQPQATTTTQTGGTSVAPTGAAIGNYNNEPYLVSNGAVAKLPISWDQVREIYGNLPVRGLSNEEFAGLRQEDPNAMMSNGTPTSNTGSLFNSYMNQYQPGGVPLPPGAVAIDPRTGMPEGGSWNGTDPATGSWGGFQQPVPQFDPSTFDFGAFDLPQWGGPYSAPMTNMQLDALQGFATTTQQNPIAQTLNFMGQQGANMQDLGAAFGPNGGTMGGRAMQNLFNPGAMVPTIPGLTDMTLPNQTLGDAAGRAGQTGNYGQFMDVFNQIAQNGVAPTDFTGAQNAVNRGMDLSTQFGNYDPVMASYGSFINGTGFNTDPLFGAQQQSLESEIARNEALLREQFSALGLGDSSDFIDTATRTGNEARNALRANQLETQRLGFEANEGRRLGATQGMQSAIGQQYGERANAAGTMMQGGDVLAQIAQMIFGQNATNAGMRMQGAQGGADLVSRGVAENQTAAQILAQIADQQSQNAQVPWQQQMAISTGIEAPALDRYLQAALAQSGMEQQGMDRAMQALAMQSGMYGNMFNMAEQTRGIADQDIARRMMEYARTQGGGLNQMNQFMGQQPGLNVGITPSTGSQVGSMIPGAVSIIGLLLDLFGKK